jgi:RNA polymerase sigma factor (sigma-70 family)
VDERRALENAVGRARPDVGGYIDELDARPPGRTDGLEPLVLRAQAGDAAAREQLIERLLPLVAGQARRLRTEGLDPADLVQEGVVGLLRALARFDPDRGAPFVAYASWWVRNAMQELRSDFVRPLRLPPRALRQLAELKAEHHRIYVEERRDASARELAELTEIEPGQVDALLRADAGGRSLDEPVRGTEAELGTLGDLLDDPLSAEAYEEVVDTITGEQLRALMARLSERERDVLDARFGFGRPGERLAEIGDRLGVSAERVRQIEARALAKLRAGA